MSENIRVYTQNSIRINEEEKIIYIDSFKMNEEPKDADFVLITHDHYDHFSPEDIKKVACEKTVLIVPKKMEKKAEELRPFVKRIETVSPSKEYEIDGLKFETVPAYNILKPFHPKMSEWVGYILVLNGKRIYIAGDTDVTNEAKSVKCDIALVPIGGFYTMDAKNAAEFINTIKPSVAIPVHFGSVVGSPKDADVFMKLVKEPVKTEMLIEY